MPATLEKRVEELERKFAELSAHVIGLQAHLKNPWRTYGGLEDDESSREAERLGREYRQQQSYEKEIAGGTSNAD